MISAFSRETPDEGKVYVQHKIKEHGPYLAELILSNAAYIYVSGRAKFMPKSVEKAFTEILSKKFGEQMEEVQNGADYIATMKKTGRYTQEVW